MPQITPKEQIAVIKEVTREAMKSKESAHQFLVDAGIVEEKKSGRSPGQKSKQKK